MKRQLALICLAFLLNLGGVQDLAAQDLVITNARIVDANGGVIERGNIVVRNGRIESVVAGTRTPGLLTEIDVRGMTAMPGFIDAHRHIMRGDDDQWFREESVDRMQEFLDAGFTTLMSGSGPVPGIVELRRRIEEGELVGPRIITSGRANTGSTPREARAQVQMSAEAGVQIIKTSISIAPTPAEKETLAAIVDEGRRHGLDIMVHAVSVPSMLAAVEADAAKLVHTPTRGGVRGNRGPYRPRGWSFDDVDAGDTGSDIR